MTVNLDAVDDELTPAQLAALDAMDGGFDPADLDPDDLDVDPPAEWLAMSPEERLAAPRPAGSAVPEVLDAGFTHRDGGAGPAGSPRAGPWTGWSRAGCWRCSPTGPGTTAWAACPTTSSLA